MLENCIYLCDEGVPDDRKRHTGKLCWNICPIMAAVAAIPKILIILNMRIRFL